MNTTLTTHRFTVETTVEGYGALARIGDDTIYTDGATLDELVKNIHDALQLYYDGSSTPRKYSVELVNLPMPLAA